MRSITEQIKRDVEAALQEDVGSGDVTAALIPSDRVASAQLIARESAVLCGVDWFEASFLIVRGAVELDWMVKDGDAISTNQVLCNLTGSAGSILTAERTALNFLQTLSGVATQTAVYVKAIEGTDAWVLDTRKTIPGMRMAQKYAVTCGGGHNHRMGLYDKVLIKENHIRAAGSIAQALALAQQIAPRLAVETEVESLMELEEALQAGAVNIMLDNFSIEQLAEAVKLAAGKARLEASGGVTLENIRAIAETGVDDISVGRLTKDVKAVDYSLLFL